MVVIEVYTVVKAVTKEPVVKAVVKAVTKERYNWNGTSSCHLFYIFSIPFERAYKSSYIG